MTAYFPNGHIIKDITLKSDVCRRRNFLVVEGGGNPPIAGKNDTPPPQERKPKYHTQNLHFAIEDARMKLHSDSLEQKCSKTTFTSFSCSTHILDYGDSFSE